MKVLSTKKIAKNATLRLNSRNLCNCHIVNNFSSSFMIRIYTSIMTYSLEENVPVHKSYNETALWISAKCLWWQQYINVLRGNLLMCSFSFDFFSLTKINTMCRTLHIPTFLYYHLFRSLWFEFMSVNFQARNDKNTSTKNAFEWLSC